MGGLPLTRHRSIHVSRNLSRALPASLRDRLRRRAEGSFLPEGGIAGATNVASGGRHPDALWTIVQHNDLVAGIQELRRYY